MNKKLLLIGVFLVGAASLVVYFLFGTEKGATLGRGEVLSGEVQMRMGEDEYTPQDLIIKRGTKVTFINESESLRWPASDLHPSHGIYSEFDAKSPIEKGGNWSFTFDKNGEWGYHDHLAPYITGIIKVVD